MEFVLDGAVNTASGRVVAAHRLSVGWSCVACIHFKNMLVQSLFLFSDFAIEVVRLFGVLRFVTSNLCLNRLYDLVGLFRSSAEGILSSLADTAESSSSSTESASSHSAGIAQRTRGHSAGIAQRIRGHRAGIIESVLGSFTDGAESFGSLLADGAEGLGSLLGQSAFFFGLGSLEAVLGNFIGERHDEIEREAEEL